jgi:hypothetical protein
MFTHRLLISVRSHDLSAPVRFRAVRGRSAIRSVGNMQLYRVRPSPSFPTGRELRCLLRGDSRTRSHQRLCVNLGGCADAPRDFGRALRPFGAFAVPKGVRVIHISVGLPRKQRNLPLRDPHRSFHSLLCAAVLLRLRGRVTFALNCPPTPLAAFPS